MADLSELINRAEAQLTLGKHTGSATAVKISYESMATFASFVTLLRAIHKE